MGRHVGVDFLFLSLGMDNSCLVRDVEYGVVDSGG